MKKILVLIILSGFVAPVFADTIYRSYDTQDGYRVNSLSSGNSGYQYDNNSDNYNNIQRNNLPSSMGNQKIEYGYNSRGDYVPTSIGGKKVEYGKNARGQYELSSVDGLKVEYGYNSKGQYGPVSIGGNKIDIDMSKFQNAQYSY